MNISWKWSCFSELTVDELYEIMALRERVFLLEQKIAEPDADGMDRQAWHLHGWTQPASGAERQLIGYLRAFSPGVKYDNEASLGRVVIAPERRGKGLGREIMREAIFKIHQQMGVVGLRISAQAYLEKFYHELGFKTCGELYLEARIPHLEMLLTPPEER